MNFFIFSAILTFSICTGCTTTSTYEQFQQSRKEIPAKISRVLASTKATLDANKTLFDKCFLDKSGKKIEGTGLLHFTASPRVGHLSLEIFSSPDSIWGTEHENFGRCAEIVLESIQTTPDVSFDDTEKYGGLIRIIYPSWENLDSGETRLDLENVTQPNKSVCMLAMRQYFEVTKWDVLKKDGRYVSDSLKSLGKDELFLCSDQDLVQDLKFDETAIRKRFPVMDGNHVVDSIYKR